MDRTAVLEVSAFTIGIVVLLMGLVSTQAAAVTSWSSVLLVLAR